MDGWFLEPQVTPANREGRFLGDKQLFDELSERFLELIIRRVLTLGSCATCNDGIEMYKIC